MMELTVTASKIYPPKEGSNSPAMVLPEDRNHPAVKVWPDLWASKGPIHQGQTFTVKGTMQTYKGKDELVAKDIEFAGSSPQRTNGATQSSVPNDREAKMAAMGFAHRQATPTTDAGELAALYATGYEAWNMFEEYLKAGNKPVEHKAEDVIERDATSEIPF